MFIVHRNDTFDRTNGDRRRREAQPLSECCVPAPPVLEFDPAGNLVNAWGGRRRTGYVWPTSNHGISIDNKNNVWIGGNGRVRRPAPGVRGHVDSFILKFTHDGKFLMQIGVPAADGEQQQHDDFGRVAKISFDVKANEAFVADGYGNQRVAVIDMDNGQDQALLGRLRPRAVGLEPRPVQPGRAARSQQFRNPVHCAEPTPDGLVYVCDRAERPHSGLQERAASS